VSGTVRLLDFNVHPVPATIAVAGVRTEACGAGCVTFRARGTPQSLRVHARLAGRSATAVIPIQWQPRGTAAARRILRAAVAAVDRLRSWRIAERLVGGFGGPAAVSSYRIGGRHDYAIVAHSVAGFDQVAIGRRVWVLQPDGSWQEQENFPPQDTRELMPWWTHSPAYDSSMQARPGDAALPRSRWPTSRGRQALGSHSGFDSKST